MGDPRTVTQRGVAPVGVPLLSLIEGLAGNAEMPTGTGHAPAHPRALQDLRAPGYESSLLSVCHRVSTLGVLSREKEPMVLP